MHEAVVITGTRAAGKTTLAEHLSKSGSFGQVKAITTRAPRGSAEPNYEFVSQTEFDSRSLFIRTQYHTDFYGIEQHQVDKVISSGKIPMLLITPQSFAELQEKHPENTYLSFFIDAEDDAINSRLKVRHLSDDEAKKDAKQRLKDRGFAKCSTYRLNNSGDINDFLSNAESAIMLLWKFRNNAGILNRQLISVLLDNNILLRNSIKKNVSGSSYDLSLGDEYYYKGKIRNLSDKKPFILIEPYDYAIVTSGEYANLPNDVAGRFDLKVSLFCQGIILSNGPQVDPGFEGKLFCLLFNTSNSPVVLKRGLHYATIEFHKLIAPTDSYQGNYQAKTSIVHYLPSNTLQGGMNELKKEVEKLKNESTKIQGYILAIISLLLAIIAVYRVMN